MPKYAYKPSNSLAKISKWRREKQSINVPVSLYSADTLVVQNVPIIENVVQNIPMIENKVQNVSIIENVIQNVPIIENVVQNELSRTPDIPIQYLTKTGILSSLGSTESNNDIENQSLTKLNFIDHSSNNHTFQSKLASFIIESKISRSKTSDLLKLLKSVKDIGSLHDLPSDYRTLLYTPLSGKVKIDQIAGGEYIHFGICKGLNYLYSVNYYMRQLSVLELWFNIDGLPIDKRGQSFWPILCGVCIQQYVKPFIIGAYFGSKKPSNVFEYLNLFINELNDLLRNGITIGHTTISITLKGIIADAPARAFIKQIKGHTGYYGCEKCEVEGIHLHNSVYFPDCTAPLRTDKSFIQHSNKEHHIGESPLQNIQSFGPVSCTPLDYMHLCCLGIMKKIIKCLVKGTRILGSCGSVRLSRDQILSINSRMKVVANCLSSDFARVPVDLNDFNTFKATEFRQILFYTGPFIFKNILSKPVYNNFLFLNIAMRILACPNTVYDQNDFASDLLKHFLKTFCIIYGQGNASYNIHSVIHLANDAKKYGVVDKFSSFPYENYLQHLKKIVKPGRFPLVQLYNRISEEWHCNTSGISSSLIKYPALDGHHYFGPLPNNLPSESVIQYSILMTEQFTVRVSNLKRRSKKKDDCVVMHDGKVCIVKNILSINGQIFIVCLRFQYVIPIYEMPCPSTAVGMMECSNILPELELYDVNGIRFKACYFPKSEDFNIESRYYVCSFLHIVD